MDLQNIAKEVTIASGIQVNSRNLERILSAILVSEDFWKIVHLAHEPLITVVALLNILTGKGYINISSGKISLTPEGKGLISSTGIVAPADTLCSSCCGRTVTTDRYSDEMTLFLKIQEDRPRAIRSFDQAYVTADTVFSRIAFADSRGDLNQRDVLILGDDDLMSIALALTGIPKRIVTFEIDERIVDFIKAHTREMKVPVHVERRDLRKPFPRDLLGRADTFFCDPPESVSGMNLFLERGLAGIKGAGSSGYFGLTSAESSYRKWADLEKLLLVSGFVITDLVRDFNEYVNWDYHEQMRAWELAPCTHMPDLNWYRSSLVRVEALRAEAVRNEECSDPSIFRDLESSTT